MASLKKRAKEFETPYPVTKAITKGDAVTKLSMFVMGLGNLAHKQIVKGILFLAVEIAYLLFMIEGGINNLYHLITLGGRAQEEVWNEAKGIYRRRYDNSVPALRSSNDFYYGSLLYDLACQYEERL